MPTKHNLTQGDTYSPLAVQLRQRNTSGDLANTDLTGFKVKFAMTGLDGTAKIVASTSGVSITSTTEGQVQYDFGSTEVDSPGLYYAWFITETSTGAEVDTYPADGRSFMIEVHPSEARSS
jgi:hypothetical protein